MEAMEIEYVHLYDQNEVLDLPHIQKLWKLDDQAFAEMRTKITQEMKNLGILNDAWDSRESRRTLQKLEQTVAGWLPKDLKAGNVPVLPTFHGLNTIRNLAERIHWDEHHQESSADQENLDDAKADNTGSKRGKAQASKKQTARDSKRTKRESDDVPNRREGTKGPGQDPKPSIASAAAANDLGSAAPAGTAIAKPVLAQAGSARDSAAPSDSTLISDMIKAPVDSPRPAVHSPVLRKMVQIRRFTGFAVLYRPQELARTVPAPASPTSKDLVVGKLNELARQDLDFDPAREKIVYETLGAHDIWVKNDAVLRAVLEEMIESDATRYTFTIKVVHG